MSTCCGRPISFHRLFLPPLESPVSSFLSAGVSLELQNRAPVWFLPCCLRLNPLQLRPGAGSDTKNHKLTLNLQTRVLHFISREAPVVSPLTCCRHRWRLTGRKAGDKSALKGEQQQDKRDPPARTFCHGSPGLGTEVQSETGESTTCAGLAVTSQLVQVSQYRPILETKRRRQQVSVYSKRKITF